MFPFQKIALQHILLLANNFIKMAKSLALENKPACPATPPNIAAPYHAHLPVKVENDNNNQTLLGQSVPFGFALLEKSIVDKPNGL